MLWHLCIPLFCHGVVSVPPFCLQARHEFPAITQSRDQEIQRTDIRQSRDHGIRTSYNKISRCQEIKDQRKVGDARLLIKAQGRCWQCVQAWDCLKNAIQVSRGFVQQDLGCLGAGEGAGVSADMTHTTDMTDMTVPAPPQCRIDSPAPPPQCRIDSPAPPPRCRIDSPAPPPPPHPQCRIDNPAPPVHDSDSGQLQISCLRGGV